MRYPATNELFVLERVAGGGHGERHLEQASAAGRIRTRSAALADHPAVVVASERMDEDPAWRPLRPGELLHIDDQLHLRSHSIIDHPPRHPLSLSQLGSHAAASQTTKPLTATPQTAT